jgi:hypothetical protein
VSFSEKFDPIGLVIETGVEMTFEIRKKYKILLMIPMGEVFTIVDGRRILKNIEVNLVIVLAKLDIVRRRC